MRRCLWLLPMVLVGCADDHPMASSLKPGDVCMVSGGYLIPRGSRIQVERDWVTGPKENEELNPEGELHPTGSRIVDVLVLDGEKKGERILTERWNLRPLTAP